MFRPRKFFFVKDYVFPLHSTNEETFPNYTQILTTYVNENMIVPYENFQPCFHVK